MLVTFACPLCHHHHTLDNDAGHIACPSCGRLLQLSAPAAPNAPAVEVPEQDRGLWMLLPAVGLAVLIVPVMLWLVFGGAGR